ncbi:MAG TPA: tetratricopeptide repeat protein [Thermoanaerobaculia bacterium]|jgi:tetratricopeptide (TPR) repeat protein
MAEIIHLYRNRFLRRLVAGSLVTVVAALGPAAARAAADAQEAGGDALPASVEAAYQFVLAKILVEEADFREAEKAFQRTLELDDSDPYSHLEVARFHYDQAYQSRSAERRRQQLLKAAEHSGVAVELAGENRDALFLHAQIHFRLGEHQLASLNLAQETFEKLRGMTAGDLQVLTTLGQIYFMKRRPEKAAEVLREAVAYLPNHRVVQRMLVDALLGSGAFEEADAALVKLLELDPTSVDDLLRLAELRSENGDHRGAAEVLRAAPEEARQDARVRQSLAREMHLAGDDAAALTLVDALIEEQPDRDGLRRLRVAVLTSLARYADAIADLQPLLREDDEPRRRLQDAVLLSRLYERVGNAARALAALRDELERGGGAESVQLRLALAGVLERQGRVDEAVTLLERELASAPPEELAVFGPALAEVLDRAGRTDEALRVLEEAEGRLAAAGKHETVAALQLRKLALLTTRERWEELAELAPQLAAADDAELRSAARRLHAEALAELGRLPEALEILDSEAAAPGEERRALAKRVELLFAHGRDKEALALLAGATAGGEAGDLFFAAQLFQRAERYEPVVELMERLLDQDPDSLQALFLLGATHERRGEREASIAAFERLLALEPDHAPTLNYLGYMWAERGENLEQALDLIRRAVAIEPDNGAYVDSLGWVYYQRGDYDQARQHLEWAARLLPTDPTIFEHLGDLYLKLEDASRARDSYRQAVALEGDNAELVRRKLERLEQGGP